MGVAAQAAPRHGATRSGIARRSGRHDRDGLDLHRGAHPGQTRRPLRQQDRSRDRRRAAQPRRVRSDPPGARSTRANAATSCSSSFARTSPTAACSSPMARPPTQRSPRSSSIRHEPINLGASNRPAHEALPAVHHIASLLERWIAGTLHDGSNPPTSTTTSTSSRSGSTIAPAAHAACSGSGWCSKPSTPTPTPSTPSNTRCSGYLTQAEMQYMCTIREHRRRTLHTRPAACHRRSVA